jgi:hypothetical protein
MKTIQFKTDYLIPLAGVALVVGGALVTVVHLDLERKAHAGEALAVTLNSLAQDQRLSEALRTLDHGDVAGAAQSLDLLLCDNILLLNSQLEAADEPTRACVMDSFRRIGRARPKHPEASLKDSTSATTDDQLAAQRILALAMAGDTQAK